MNCLLLFVIHMCVTQAKVQLRQHREDEIIANQQAILNREKQIEKARLDKVCVQAR